MAILSIEDFKKASQEEIDKILSEMYLGHDLNRYLAWLNSHQGDKITGKFDLGYSKRSLGIHPSSISKKGVCPLRIYFEATGEIEPRKRFRMKDQLVFDLGTMIHFMLQHFFEDMYEENFKAEIPLVDKNLGIKSHTDGRFKWPDFKFLLEIKSIKEGGGYGIDTIRNKPMKEHVRQAHCYMYCDDTPFCNIFYFCKNTSEIVEKPIAWDQNVWDEILSENLPIIESVKRKERPVAKVGGHCKDCAFLHGCEEGENYVQIGTPKRRSIRRRSAG